MPKTCGKKGYASNRTKRSCFGCGRPMPRHSMGNTSETKNEHLLCKSCRCSAKSPHLMFRNDLKEWLLARKDAYTNRGILVEWAESLASKFLRTYQKQFKARYLAQDYTKILKKP